MKKTIWTNSSYFYSFLVFLLLGYSFFSHPSVKVYAAVGDAPTIAITSPEPNSVENSTTVVISGTYTDDNVQKGDLLFTAKDQGNVISDSTSTDWVITDDGTEKTWKYTATFEEGKHDLTIEIKENNNIVSTSVGSANLSLTVDTTRPYIESTSIVIPGTNEEVMKGFDDFTKVPLNAQLRVTVADNNPITNFPTSPIKLVLDSQVKDGTVNILPKGELNGVFRYELTFTPKDTDSDRLVYNQTYIVYVDPTLVDDANNPVFSRFFKFTTKSQTDWGYPNKADNPDNPHGNYSLTTNLCANCHSTHVNSHLPTSNSVSDREGGTYLLTYNDELTQKASESYCMACHDGTVNNAPIIDKINNTSHHVSDLKEAASCTSCHNPHLEWSEDNQNLLKDHVVYTHSTNDEGKKLTSGDALTADTLKVDSLDQPCDSCHGNNEINTSLSSDNYQVLEYKTANSAVGSISTDEIGVNDYSLCLRCHNANKNKIDSTIADIATYYSDSSSRHYFALPAGKSTQADGTKLNGPIACSDCHETHGSDNQAMLREELGNARITDDSLKFKSTGSNWDAANERKFCLTCHSNSTELYGRTAQFKTLDENGVAIDGHQIGDTDQACSYCHSDSYDKNDSSTKAKAALEAAHSPKTGKPSNDK